MEELVPGGGIGASGTVGQPKKLVKMRSQCEAERKMASMKKGRSASMTRKPVNVGKTFHRVMPGIHVFTWDQ
jgi:hypothetical protein